MPALPKANPLYARFRESHHHIARMFAAGLTISKVASETGYSRRRLQILLNDPSFQDLILEKSKTLDEVYEEVGDRYANLSIANMLRAESELAETFEDYADAGERMPVKFLMAISKDRADRFGYGPRSVRVNVNADFAVRLDRAIERSDSAKVIEARPSTPSPLPNSLREVGPHPQEAIETQTLNAPSSSDAPAAAAPARPKSGFRVAPSFTNVMRRPLSA